MNRVWPSSSHPSSILPGVKEATSRLVRNRLFAACVLIGQLVLGSLNSLAGCLYQMCLTHGGTELRGQHQSPEVSLENQECALLLLVPSSQDCSMQTRLHYALALGSPPGTVLGLFPMPAMESSLPSICHLQDSAMGHRVSPWVALYCHCSFGAVAHSLPPP